VTDRLSHLQKSESNTDIAQTLTDNKNNLMGAGQLHNIGHNQIMKKGIKLHRKIWILRVQGSEY